MEFVVGEAAQSALAPSHSCYVSKNHTCPECVEPLVFLKKRSWWNVKAVIVRAGAQPLVLVRCVYGYRSAASSSHCSLQAWESEFVLQKKKKRGKKKHDSTSSWQRWSYWRALIGCLTCHYSSSPLFRMTTTMRLCFWPVTAASPH